MCILAIGRQVAPALKAAEELDATGVSATVWDVRSCMPLDDTMLADARRHRLVVTTEDGIRDGGIGMSIAARFSETDDSPAIEILGLPTQFLPHGEPQHLHARYGLDAAGIVAAVRRRM
ncbi:MAG: transketolase C-terminal domain-containing protein [Ilumatobacteraceae bacterium]